MSSVWVCPRHEAEDTMRHMVQAAYGIEVYKVASVLAYMLGNFAADYAELGDPVDRGERATELLRNFLEIIEQTVVLRLGDGIKGH